MKSGARLGIVVPTLDESRHLPHLLDDLARLSVSHRIVVVDGGSCDGTVELARARGVEVRSAPRGRASQLNAGAAALETPWLLFLHADVRLPPGARRALKAAVSGSLDGPRRNVTGDERFDAAVFRFRLAGDRTAWRIIELGQRLRERFTGIPYGDQGLLVKKDVFRAVDGYPDLPLMEDVEIIRRLRRRGTLRRLPADLVASPRRYERDGPWRVALRNSVLALLHLMGSPPARLARWYDPDPDPDSEPDPARIKDSPSPGIVTSDRRILLIFARAPVSGRVKTRLAREVGAAEALRLYREIGRAVVDQVRGGPFRIVVCFDPPNGEEAVRRWLGSEDLEFRPQSGGDLGERMSEAFRWAFGDADEVCIIGTDAPGVDEDRVAEAFLALRSAGVALGPSTDGGYYLLALDRHRPELFHGIPWSTPSVLERTLRRVREAGTEARLLEPATDLDTAEDLETLGLDAGLFLHGGNI